MSEEKLKIKTNETLLRTIEAYLESITSSANLIWKNTIRSEWRAELVRDEALIIINKIDALTKIIEDNTK